MDRQANPGGVIPRGVERNHLWAAVRHVAREFLEIHMRRKQFWPPEETSSPSGARLEIRAQLAWQLLQHFALIAGTRGPEDSQGRAATDLLAADVVVDR